MKIKVKGTKSEAREFPHVTEEARQYAQDLWNKFNKDLLERGLKLHYDYASGSFFVAAAELAGVTVGEPDALSGEELKQVIAEGGFDDKALNNPPWFTNPGEYTLKVKA